MDEVLGVYARELEEKLQRALKAIKDLETTIELTRSVKLWPSVVPKAEADALRQRLMKSSAGVSCELFADYADIDILEVVRRGANRICPADKKGEELRDVINWLATLSFARKTGHEVSFVSADRGFWSNNQTLHSTIAEDITQNHVSVRLYRDLDDFLGQNALSSESVTASRAREIFRHETIDTLALNRIIATFENLVVGEFTIHVLSARLVALDFQSGTVYRVSDDSEYVDADYKMQGDMTVSAASVQKEPFSDWERALGATVDLGSVMRPKNAITMQQKATLTIRFSARIDHQQVQRVELEETHLDEWIPAEETKAS